MSIRNRFASWLGCRAGGMRRTVAAAAAVAGAAVALVACGGSSASSSASPASGAGGGSNASQTANSNKLAQFSQCMRAHGVSDFPDPVSGHLNIRFSKGSDLDPSLPAFKSALARCKSLEPAGFGSGSVQSTGQQSQLVRFSRCMRKNGVSNFPDPQPNGTMLIHGGGVDPNSPQFQRAMQACRSLLPPGAIGG